MRKIVNTISVFILGLQCQAQVNEAVNRGLIYTKTGTQVSSNLNFTNESSGNFINNGEFHFYRNYKNEGLFSYSSNSTSGYVVFEGKNDIIQKITGDSPSFFYDVLFNKPAIDYAFHLDNEIESSGIVNFYDGIVLVNKNNGGSFTFLDGANQTNASSKSFVDGLVTKEGNDSFKFPIGGSGNYRFAGISAPSNVVDQYIGQYFYENTDNLYPHKNKTGVINKINDKEYWIINKEIYSKNSVILTLSWDDQITPKDLLVEDAKYLHVVRWDLSQNLWVDEGGIVDFQNKTVTTPVEVDGFGIFTLATIKPNLLNPGDVVIYDGVTPDGDGINDYLIIDNIQNFPKNSVKIFNRWGTEVYHTSNYDSDNNVFNGFANTGQSFGGSNKLPTGTYYYILEYEYNRDGESYMVNKAGFLHLENND
ncbi:gliding motility-associated C-terminal domain-containing protein [Paenimyroides tangerinum]|uniref:Gliding motility-associated C-terminal domain-containing protein n=1 Tax=Paenimyroides tangerinum TaxID=2488728 RepID=A0A3P3W7F4_9FLAO|nr:gliding motility-associated C-terminal domain-containing protein [Paenimyroides tangerinum]